MPDQAPNLRTRAGALLCLAAVLLAGCVGGGPASPTASGPVETAEASPTPEDLHSTAGTVPPRSETPAFPEWSPPAEPFEAIAVGEADAGVESHTYSLWNRANTSRTIRVSIGRNGSTIHEEAYAFPARGRLEIALHAPADYRITVDPPGADTGRSLVDPVDAFDCNARRHQVAILADGSVTTRSVTTLVLCRTVTATATPADG